MNNNSKISEAVPGTESEESEIKKISGWLQKDLDSMVTLLNAIRGDTELREYMAVWFHGRMRNAKHKAELNANVNGK